MLYRKLGKTGIDISVLGFGCMRLPVIDSRPENIDYGKATDMLHYAIENGVNYIDTAYFYHAAVFGTRGHSEPFVGDVLSGGLREKVHLATKLPLFILKEKEQMESYLNEQLERLKTGYLDFYLLHALNGETWERVKKLGIREFLDRKKKEGHIRFPAFSFHGEAEDFMRICDEYDWAYAQIQYNYMDVDFQAGYKGLKYAADKGMGVVIMEPLKGGKLGHDMPVEMTSIIDSYKVKRTPAEWALRFVWNEPGVSSVLSGMTTMEQVVENIQLADKGLAGSLTREDLSIYPGLKASMETKIKADCTSCRYCMPCSSGVEIPEVLASLNNASMWNDPNPWATGYVRVKGKAGKCTECRECEDVCPQGLPVSDLMKEAVTIFGS